MQRQNITPKSSTVHNTTALIRARSCMHLCSGDAVGAFIEYPHDYEEAPRFSILAAVPAQSTASEWVAGKIEDMAAMCEALEYTERPLILPIPACALMDKNLLDACTRAAAQTRLCHQEISLEITDAAITANPEDAENFMHAFRRKGFRVSVDARKSWRADLTGPCWLLVDTLRIRASDLETEETLDSLIDAASSAGVAIVAERPYWRDGEALASMGIDYGLRPVTDS